MKKSTLVFFILSCSFFVNGQTIQEAKKFTDNEQYENATTIYKAIIATNFADPSIYYYYAENLLLSDNPDSAKIIFDQGQAIDPNHPLMKIGNAKILFDRISLREAKRSSDQDGSNAELRDRYEQAQKNVMDGEILIEAATTNSKDINVLVEAIEALLQYKNKNTDKAKILLDKAYAINPKNIDVLLLFGDLYGELNNGTLAADYYNKALDLDKTSARAIVSKGRLYMRSTNYEGAAREFLDAIKVEPSYAPAHRELGECYIKLGKLAEAKEEYKKYLELSRGNCPARIRYAQFLYASKDYSESISELNQVRQRCDSNIVSMWRLFMYDYYELKDTTKALDAVNHLIRLLPEEKRVSRDFEFHGKILIGTSSDSSTTKTGIEQLQKALNLDPGRLDLLIDMANAWSKLRKYSNAIILLNQKIALTKDAKSADYYMLARAYYFNRQFIETDSIIKKVNELSPTYASGWILRAQANANIDSTSEEGLAKPFYEKYIELAIADSANSSRYTNGLIESYGYLAYYYVLKKDNKNGAAFLKKKLELITEPAEKKKLQDAIDQLEGRGPKPKSENK